MRFTDKLNYNEYINYFTEKYSSRDVNKLRFLYFFVNKNSQIPFVGYISPIR